ncbi:hypothetical protein ACU5AY_10950 [Rhizobium sp. PAMB 3174]
MPRTATLLVSTRLLLRTAAIVLPSFLAFAHIQPAFALSELQSTPADKAGDTATEPQGAEDDGTATDEGESDEDSSEGTDIEQGLPDPDPMVKQKADVDQPKKEVEYIFDASKLPEPVRRMRQLIVEAAASGDVTRLAQLTNPGPDQTQLGAGGSTGEDPVAVLKSFSGDPDGREILAIVLDLLQAGAAHFNKGTPDETYEWPYFAEKDLDKLTPPEVVELLRIVTAGDYANMLDYGGYNFYRMGISPDGTWKFMLAGE